MLRLRLHLRLDGVGRVANDDIRRAIEKACAQSVRSLLLPGSSLLIMSH